MSEVKFTVKVDDVDYQCKRVIEGKQVFTQTIYVDGFGYEDDTEQYSNKNPHQNISLMDHFARQIARSIISKAKKST